IMALVMAASGIHAESAETPAEVLRRIEESLGEELASTEMFLTVFYAVIDPAAQRIVYANAAHPHAFLVSTQPRDAGRLEATRPLPTTARWSSSRCEHASGQAARPALPQRRQYPRQDRRRPRPGARGRRARDRGGDWNPDCRPRPPRRDGDRHREGPPAGDRVRSAECGVRN